MEMVAPSIVLEKEHSDQYLIPERLSRVTVKFKEQITLTEIELFVCDSENGKPINRAMISIDSIGFTAVCDDFGKASIKKILTGSYCVDIIFPGFIASSNNIHLSGKTPFRLHVKMVRNS
jgi:hypothetical protein